MTNLGSQNDLELEFELIYAHFRNFINRSHPRFEWVLMLRRIDREEVAIYGSGCAVCYSELLKSCIKEQGITHNSSDRHLTTAPILEDPNEKIH